MNHLEKAYLRREGIKKMLYAKANNPWRITTYLFGGLAIVLQFTALGLILNDFEPSDKWLLICRGSSGVAAILFVIAAAIWYYRASKMYFDSLSK